MITLKYLKFSSEGDALIPGALNENVERSAFRARSLKRFVQLRFCCLERPCSIHRVLGRDLSPSLVPRCSPGSLSKRCVSCNRARSLLFSKLSSHHVDVHHSIRLDRIRRRTSGRLRLVVFSPTLTMRLGKLLA